MLSALNIFFFAFHTVFIVFNLFGWIFKKTRKWNLITLFLTGFSWIILGFWYGFGYCPCTQWHWDIRTKLGYMDMPVSYIKFLLDSITGLTFNENLVDFLTLSLFIPALSFSIYLNLIKNKE